MGRVSMCFFLKFWEPYLHTCCILFYVQTGHKISQRSFNKNRLPLKTAGTSSELFRDPGSFLDAMGMVMSISAESEEPKMAAVRPRARKNDRDLYF